MELTTLQSKVLTHLRDHAVGQGNAITAGALGQRFRVRSTVIRETISDLRLMEVELIGSVSAGPDPGYFIPTTLEEARAGLLHLETRIAAMSKMAAAQRRELNRRWPHEPAKQIPPRDPPTQHALFAVPSVVGRASKPDVVPASGVMRVGGASAPMPSPSSL